MKGVAQWSLDGMQTLSSSIEIDNEDRSIAKEAVSIDKCFCKKEK